MAYIRKLPSGKWQATVRHPSGRRISQTDPLRGVVAKWARDLETAFARGETRDPRAGRITVAQWYGRWSRARGVVPSTRDKTDSCWRVHCEPAWGSWPLDTITHMEAREWARSLESKRRARHRGRPADEHAPALAAATVHAAVHVMTALYAAAVRERPPLVAGNPFEGLDLPTIPPAPVDFLGHDEADALLGVLYRDYPPTWGALVETGLWVGLRPGELFGLLGDRVDWLRWLVEVTRVATRSGLREYPKSRRSHRVVPVPGGRLRVVLPELMRGRDRDAPVFAAARGGLVGDSDFRNRVWVPAVRAAGIRPVPPRVMRHTAASWLAQDGVPLAEIQRLLGHESYRTTERYAHLAPDSHERVLRSWRRMSDARGRGRESEQGHGA